MHSKNDKIEVVINDRADEHFLDIKLDWKHQ